MCGIAGLMTAGGAPDEGVLDRLAESLAHRGPDGRGRHVHGTVGLVQNRLSIIDLEGGRQPILDGEGNAVVANGEVYNYLELKADMPGQAFATGSDCEPPLHLYRRQGPGFARSLRGMYALAIHDTAHDRLVLARDPFGIKPLYLSETSPGLAFASEPQALVGAGLVRPEIDPAARAELLQLQFTTGTRTIFKGIRRLAPGETVIARDGCVQESRRLAALPAGGPLNGRSVPALLDELDEVLTESVELHQRSDVPYGMFLSGGIDSSVVLALMARLNPKGVLAFTAGFPGTGAHDERAHARELARATGARHVEVEFTEADFWALLPRVAACMDDPAADYACLPTFKLAAEARKEVKVILSGEGGDELFAGYGRYRHAMRPWPLTKRMRRKGTFDGLGVLRDHVTDHWRAGLHAVERAQSASGRSRLQAAQAVDCADWLPNDLLTKADRCLMANGIEGRVPFLDPVVAAFAFRLPDHAKVRKGLGKWLPRRWLETALPASRPFDKKRGFTVPVGEWIAKRPEIGALVAAQPGIAEICRPGAVEALFRGINKDTAFACWTLLFYALWHQRHMLGRRPEGDAFSELMIGL